MSLNQLSSYCSAFVFGSFLASFLEKLASNDGEYGAIQTFQIQEQLKIVRILLVQSKMDIFAILKCDMVVFFSWVNVKVSYFVNNNTNAKGSGPIVSI